ncbi:hypothetical protein SCAR479_01453 [Seiridium cardinale]|uniref:Proteophosphoglycan ppg4 n=1 Tax=Seiridium cardinale TaxID=138064 RepID=A0ABR2Y5G8_9PEZI
MGNTASVEELGRGRRATHKLSKPRTASHETNTLLSPAGLPSPRRRFSATRTTSLPYGTSPAPSPMWPPVESPLEDPGPTDESGKKTKSRSRSISRTATALFRSRSSQAPQGNRRRQDSLGAQTPCQSARPSRANSMIVGPSESSYVQFNAASWQSAGTRSSVAYDLNSYEAKRLLNLVEEPSHENHSIVSESHFQAAPPARKDSVKSPSVEKMPTINISRASSDVSLYAPMRRKSLLVTPGVATRIPDMPKIPQKSKARFSLPSTPARRDSLESLTVDMFSISPPSINPGLLPRAVTPCDEDYGHIGAFKLGSLRVVNGSPAMSPAVEPKPSPTGMLPSLQERRGASDYFQRQQVGDSNNAQLVVSSVAEVAPRTAQKQTLLSPLVTSPQSAGPEVNLTQSPQSPQYLPEVQLSPLTMESPSKTDVFGVLATSKHTALEDDLFEDDQAEISQPEVLDVRMDLNAKSLPPRPRLISEGRSPRDMMRADSGVAATPILEHPHGVLAKSDSGYSSNVSLRSFSAKPPVPEKDQPAPGELEVPPKTPEKDTFRTDAKLLLEPRAANLKTVPQLEMNPSPPLPQKDLPTDKVPSLKIVQPASTQKPGLPSSGTPPQKAQGPRAMLKADETRATNSSIGPELSPLSPTSSASSGASRSTGSGARKAGKLSRLLSSARKPLTVNMTQSIDMAGLTSVPKDTPISAGVDGQADVPPVPCLPKIVAIATAGEGSSTGNSFDVSFRSAGMSPAPVAPGNVSKRKSIARKPLPIRKDSMEINMLRVKAAQTEHDLRATGTCSGPLDTDEKRLFTPQAAVVGQETHTVSSRIDVKMDMPRPGEEVELGVQHSQLDKVDTVHHLEQSTFSVSGNSNADQVRKARTPPPVSMATRNQRAGPPSRTQSTPPVRGDPDASYISRRSSREDIYSYPSGQPSLSRRSSRENIHSYPPAQADYENIDFQAMTPSSGPVDRRHSSSIRTKNGRHRLPNWGVQTDHDASSRGPSSDYGRRNSMASQSSHHNSGTSLAMPNPQARSTARPTALRHRSSYDSYSYRQIQEAAEIFYEESFYQDNGPYPSVPHTNGQVYVSDPWSGLPMPQLVDQQGQCQPHVPRHHARHNSLGSRGGIDVPYRVLHSYNSPAYKNAPIWG